MKKKEEKENERKKNKEIKKKRNEKKKNKEMTKKNNKNKTRKQEKKNRRIYCESEMATHSFQSHLVLQDTTFSLRGNRSFIYCTHFLFTSDSCT